MRIGIDASSVEGKSTGVGRYLVNILNELAVIDKENEYLLFFKSTDIPEGLTKQENFKRNIVKPFIKSGFIWRNHYLHRAAYKAKPDIFHFALVKPRAENIKKSHLSLILILLIFKTLPTISEKLR